MPPKGNLKAPVSTSRDIVPVGPRHLAQNTKRQIKRDENGDKPTTARALILRNGKHGARGTGELMVVNKLTGREKLDLLAEDLVEKSKKSFLQPFRLEEALKIAESQFDAFLDDIANLQDPDLFSSVIEAEVQARTSPDRTGLESKPSASRVASIVATRIHNAYMLASAWKLILQTFRELEHDGLSDQSIKAQLKSNGKLRSQYLVLYDLVNAIIDISQAKFAVLATTTPHYARYFKEVVGSDPEDPKIIFDWEGLQAAGESFLDSIIIELCFPRAPYPKQILYQILHDAVDESPREAQRFPQQLWDAIGDLSVSIELQTLLEAPLHGAEGEAWKRLPRQMPEEYEHWIDAQLYSQKASSNYANYMYVISPLDKTQNKSVLETMWKYVNLNYKSVSGENISTLWNLDEDLDRAPQWHSFYMPELGGRGSNSDSDGPPGFHVSSKKKKPLAITAGDDGSDGSMPGLQSVSDSSKEESDDSDSDSDFDDYDDDDDDDDESGYNTEERDEIRNMLREAMDVAIEADLFDPSGAPPEIDSLAEERKGNPFLKVLVSLRGRMFTANPKLKTSERKIPRAKPGAKFGLFQSSTPTDPSEEQPPPLEPILPSGKAEGTSKPNNKQPTIEEVEDEDAAPSAAKKKKKKKKPKKKLAARATSEDQTTPSLEQQRPPETSSAPPAPINQPPVPTPAPARSKALVVAPVSPAPSKKAVVPSSKSPVPPPHALISSQEGAPYMSTTSLALSQEQNAQSARSYLKSESLDTAKTKVKSRPDHASLFSVPEKKKGFLSKLGMGRDKSTAEPKSAKFSWFSRVTKKTAGYMHQLLRTDADESRGLAPMKWEHFLKVMREMGFTYDPSTAGSSVRFDPPDSRDRSITFHKPHPDPTIQPVKLKEFGKKLKKYYGWNEEDFNKHMS